MAFDKNGCKVAILGRRKERLDAVVSVLPASSYVLKQSSLKSSLHTQCRVSGWLQIQRLGIMSPVTTGHDLHILPFIAPCCQIWCACSLLSILNTDSLLHHILKIYLAAQVAQMSHGLSVVADLTQGDAEMQRAVKETIDAFGGLDIIVNRCAWTTSLQEHRKWQLAISLADGRPIPVRHTGFCREMCKVHKGKCQHALSIKPPPLCSFFSLLYSHAL